MPVGVLGADSAVGGGAKLERTRITVLLGGEVLRSIADAARGGGGGAEFPPPIEKLDVLPGDAVCALDGGGGGAAGLGALSAPAFLLTQRFVSGS